MSEPQHPHVQWIPKIRITLARLSRGDYRWEVTVNEDDETAALGKLTRIELALREKYAAKTEEAPAAASQAVPLPPAVTTTSQEKGLTIEDVLRKIPKDLTDEVEVEDAGRYITITPKKYIAPEKFMQLNNAVRSMGGEYFSSGNVHAFIVPKHTS